MGVSHQLKRKPTTENMSEQHSLQNCLGDREMLLLLEGAGGWLGPQVIRLVLALS